MPAVVRLTDKDNKKNVVIKASSTVFANNLGVARKGDKLKKKNSETITQGSSNVFADNQPVARVGDKDTEPGILISGSPSVFANDSGGGPSTPAPIIPDRATLYTELDPYVQPTATRLEGAEQHDDDPHSDPNYVYYREYAEQDAGLPPAPDTPLQIGTAPPPPPNVIPTDCGDIAIHPLPFPDNFQLSPNFTLGMLTNQTLISKYNVQGQNGLGVREIVCNLRALCINVLEPMRAMYGANMIINSAFRVGKGNSQHYSGQACDISFTDTPTSAARFARAQEIVNTFVYDQYIYEQNISVWHHISYNQYGKNRRQVLSKPRGSRYYAGLIRF